jgi:type IV pilus assembly protein PilF
MRHKFLLLVALLSAFLVVGCGGTTTRSTEPAAPAKSGAESARERARLHTELGMAYLSGGQLTTAFDEGRIAINSDANYSPAYNLMGLTLMQMQDFPSAEEQFQRALRLTPDDAEINGNMGWFLCQTGRETSAFAYFEAAARNPHYATPARPLINASLCATRIKDYKRAEDYVNNALRRDPGNVYGQYVQAAVLYQQGRLPEARARLTEVHRQADPTAASTWLALLIERKSGDREAELRWATQLRRKFADSPEYKKLMQGSFD